MDEQAFWDRADRRESGCWHWRGHESGYHVVKWDGTSRPVHRVAYELVNGPIPDGMVIRHVCDNPPCFNPAHLLVGTHKENRQDQVDRDRRRPNRVLMPLKVAAQRLGVRPATLRQQIRAGKLQGVNLGAWYVHDIEVERYRQQHLGRIGRPKKATDDEVWTCRSCGESYPKAGPVGLCSWEPPGRPEGMRRHWPTGSPMTLGEARMLQRTYDPLPEWTVTPREVERYRSVSLGKRGRPAKEKA